MTRIYGKVVPRGFLLTVFVVAGWNPKFPLWVALPGGLIAFMYFLSCFLPEYEYDSRVFVLHPIFFRFFSKKKILKWEQLRKMRRVYLIVPLRGGWMSYFDQDVELTFADPLTEEKKFVLYLFSSWNRDFYVHIARIVELCSRKGLEDRLDAGVLSLAAQGRKILDKKRSTHP